ncbi:MAG: GrpB family protein [Chloroflexota bacterium]|nr:GrpB family protein [Chloroflexota bacterium]
MIEIVDYQERWPTEFRAIGARLRELLGPAALRIDHIGSTAVPGLAAKDVIDVQITVKDLDPSLERGLAEGSFVRRAWTSDHRPPGVELAAPQLEKRFFAPPEGERPANIHVRVAGRFNQRYALLCRDYLRAHPAAARAYAVVKRALARIVGDDVDAFYEVKDPVFDILMAGAEEWAAATGWRPGPSDA